MARAVVWTEAATQDLDEVADFIARDSRFYASAFVREARAAGQSLRRFPERGRVVPESASQDIRELFVRDYRLIYQLRPAEVAIITFIHGARDLAAIWARRGGPTGAGA